jgi:hypothetical protein
MARWRPIARRTRCGVVVAVVAVVSVLAPTAEAWRARSPALGNWEGRGPHGLPLSFRFVRSHRHVGVKDLVVGYGLSCPASRIHAEAVAYRAGYIGPGRPSPFLHTFHIPANGFLIDLQGATTFGTTLEGRLRGRRLLALAVAILMKLVPYWPRRCACARDRLQLRRSRWGRTPLPRPARPDAPARAPAGRPRAARCRYR